jgi:hypothetical protein
MTPSKFSELVRHHFQYLVADYGFSIVALRGREVNPGNVMNYESDRVGVEIRVMRAEVSVTIGTQSDPPDVWVDIGHLIPYLFPERDEPVYIYPESPDDQIEWQVKRIARLIRQTLDSVLRGEFTQWNEVREYWQERGRRYYKEVTGLNISESSWDGRYRSRLQQDKPEQAK